MARRYSRHSRARFDRSRSIFPRPFSTSRSYALGSDAERVAADPLGPRRQCSSDRCSISRQLVRLLASRVPSTKAIEER